LVVGRSFSRQDSTPSHQGFLFLPLRLGSEFRVVMQGVSGKALFRIRGIGWH
jgi:hypothetical protein